MNEEYIKQVKPYLRPGMTSTLTVALVCPKLDLSSKSKNLDTFINYAKDAANKGADIVVFPETALTGYQLCELNAPSPLYDVAETIPGPSTEQLITAAQMHNIYIITGMFEADADYIGRIYNSAVLVGPEGLLGTYRKTSIESVSGEVHFDMHTWGAGHGSNIPVWEIKQGWRVAITICYDLWVPEIARVAVVKGADLVINISAIPRPFISAPAMILPVRALENQTGMAFCNHLGLENGVDFPGGRMAVEANNEVILPMDGTIDNENMDLAKFNAETLYQARKGMTQFRDRIPEAYGALVKPTEFTLDYVPYNPPKA